MQDYPPALEPEQLTALITEIKDWQITHGSLLKLVFYDDDHTVPQRPIGAAVCPTPFPRHCFDQARQLASVFNKFYAAVSEDDAWLHTVLLHLIETDDLIGSLWKVHHTAKEEGHVQHLALAIIRADYMLHGQSLSSAALKQVEVNTYSVAGGTHGNLVSNMHRSLTRNGSYHFGSWCPYPYSLPVNQTIAGIVSALAQAHEAYGLAKSGSAKCVLMVVQPFNVNICDERPLEYALWDRDVPTYRVCFGVELLACTELGPNRELLFTPKLRPNAKPMEVSVVYWRAGYDPEEYDEEGKACRLLVERSLAIKCPTVACHLATLKRVQQALAEPGALARFLSPEEVALIEPVIMPMQVLDDSEAGKRMQALATRSETAINYVLKPSLEGGGHNVYREKIPALLDKLPKQAWRDYILMKMIEPPDLTNVLISWSEHYHGPVASELGIFGTCMWRRSGQSNQEPDLVSNVEAGFSFKTKSTKIDEMSVVKGYGCFDSPLLVEVGGQATAVDIR